MDHFLAMLGVANLAVMTYEFQRKNWHWVALNGGMAVLAFVWALGY